MQEDLVKGPKKVYFELTRACNLACTHCLNDSGEKMPAEMSAGQVMTVVQSLCAIGVEEIRFTGGEPTIHSALSDSIRYASDHNVRSSIGTNGVSITEKYASHLAHCGLHTAVISLDGDEVEHDRIRGTGAFRRTWRGMIAMRDVGVRIKVNAVAMRSNLYSLSWLAEACHEAGFRLYIRRFIPSGRAKNSLGEFPSLTEYAELRKVLRSLLEQNDVDGHYLTDAVGHCSAGSTGMVILPDGQTRSCGFLADLGEPSYGNILSEDIGIIWRRMRESRFLIEAGENLQDLNQVSVDMPKTNCLAIAVGVKDYLVKIRRKNP
jgi:MoaA/NifB/PqqE/SkfB family radical SAM enzyme